MLRSTIRRTTACALLVVAVLGGCAPSTPPQADEPVPTTEPAPTTTTMATVAPAADGDDRPPVAMASVDLEADRLVVEHYLEREAPVGLTVHVAVGSEGLLLRTDDIERARGLAERLEADLEVTIIDVVLLDDRADDSGPEVDQTDLVTPGY